MKPFQFHLIWRLLNTFHIPEIPNKVRSIIWTNVLWMSFDYKRNQPDRILIQKCWRQKALIEVSTRLSWFPASVLSSHSRQFTRRNLRKSIPFPKSQFFFFLIFNISSYTKKTFHFSGFLFVQVCEGEPNFFQGYFYLHRWRLKSETRGSGPVFQSQLLGNCLKEKISDRRLQYFSIFEKYLTICCVSSFSSLLQTFQE